MIRSPLRCPADTGQLGEDSPDPQRSNPGYRRQIFRLCRCPANTIFQLRAQLNPQCRDGESFRGCTSRQAVLSRGDHHHPEKALLPERRRRLLESRLLTHPKPPVRKAGSIKADKTRSVIVMFGRRLAGFPPEPDHRAQAQASTAKHATSPARQSSRCFSWSTPCGSGAHLRSAVGYASSEPELTWSPSPVRECRHREGDQSRLRVHERTTQLVHRHLSLATRSSAWSRSPPRTGTQQQPLPGLTHMRVERGSQPKACLHRRRCNPANGALRARPSSSSRKGEACPRSSAAGYPRTLQPAVREQVPVPAAQPPAGQVAGQIANTPRNSRVRPPRLCYFYCMISPIRGDLTRFRVQVPPRTQIHDPDLQLFVCRLEWMSNAAGHRHGSSTPSRTTTLRACGGTAWSKCSHRSSCSERSSRSHPGSHGAPSPHRLDEND